MFRAGVPADSRRAGGGSRSVARDRSAAGRQPRRPSFREKAVWTVLDQAASSLGTFALSVVVARNSDLAEFGAFALVMTLYALTNTAVRALICTPFLMEATGEDDQRGLAAGALGAAAVLAVPLCGGLLLAAVWLAEPTRFFVLALAIGTPLLLLQDIYRFVLRQRDDLRSVALNDTLWTGCQLALAAIVLAVVETGVSYWCFAGWLGGVGIAVAHGMWRTGVLPSLPAARRFFGRTKGLGVPMVVEAFALAGSASVAQFAILAVGGLEVLAPLKGAAVVLGPVNIINGGLIFLVTPIVLKMSLAHRRRILVRCGYFAVTVAGLALAAAAILLLVPDEVGELILGQTWAVAGVAILPTALAFAAFAAQTAAMLAFRAYKVTLHTMTVQVVMFPLPAACGVVGFFLGGAEGAAWGLFASAAATAVVLWTLLLHLTSDARRRAAEPSGTAGI
jgi:O-antigen/teichoic acid export membrane protein